MLEAIYARESYVALKKTLDAAVLRHQAIASNLANLETPNYKRIDISPDFEARLQKGCWIRGCFEDFQSAPSN